MKILLVEDEATSREMLQAILAAQGHEVVPAENGANAWDMWVLGQHRLVLADWLMPEMDGLELCRKIRAHQQAPYTYFIMQTVRSGRGPFLEAMEAGVDDFITKPIIADELLARLRVAERILGLRHEVWTLEGLLSMCSYCKRIREGPAWVPLETYLAERSAARFSHGICPECYDRHVKPMLDG